MSVRQRMLAKQPGKGLDSPRGLHPAALPHVDDSEEDGALIPLLILLARDRGVGHTQQQGSSWPPRGIHRSSGKADGVAWDRPAAGQHDQEMWITTKEMENNPSPVASEGSRTRRG